MNRYAAQLVDQWAAHDLPAARAWSETLPPQVRGAARETVVRTWAATDPRGAVDYAATLPANLRERALSWAMNGWANKDVNAAVAWVERQAPGSARNAALLSVAETWTRQDPRACVEYLSHQAVDQTFEQQRQSALSQWANMSPEEVWQWGQGLTDEKQRGEAQAMALDALSRSDPANASARIGQLPTGAQADAATSVVSTWMETDSAAATRWAGSLSEGDVRASAVSSVAGMWARYDAPGAAAWLNGLPRGDARDKGIESLISDGTDGMEPTAIVRLAQSVQDADRRTGVLSSAAFKWMAQDRAKATALLAQCSDFTPEQRDNLLNAFKSASGDSAPALVPGLQ